ncbi:BnaC08g09230D [Brassica napus]|uniref:BnaC08g09230D protein n=1 Tax=Brassica napus TaxID=3708 RepID=A0A078FHF2_BRANA|nr:BnaC08g09230D [Brassica napus]
MELERFENYPWGRVAFKVWVYTALPELGANYGNPLPNNSSLPILAYKGRKGRIFFKEAILSQTMVINFVQKDIGEMFPKWEFDAEDTPAENIIKLMFVKRQWKWTMDCWEVTEASEEVHTVAHSEVTTTIVDAMREGFGTCLKEIKYLSERMEAVEKKVGITTKRKGTSFQNTTSPPKPTLEPGSESVNGTNTGRKSLPEDKGPDVPADASSSKDKAPEPSLEKRDDALALCRAKSDRTRKLAASQQSPYTANSMAKVIILNKKLYPGYNPFAPIDKKKLKELADWLKTCPHYRTPLDKKPRTSRTRWYHILRTSLEWLEDCKTYKTTYHHLHIDAWINVLKKRMCFLDHFFAQQWRFNYKDFKDSEPDQNGLGRRLPVNYTDSHWIAIWISIPKRHIVVWDSICSSISPEELDVARAGDCGM